MESKHDNLSMAKSSTPASFVLKMYNMFPYRNYGDLTGIDDLIAYLPEVSKMGYNAVWINPIQKAGTTWHQPYPGSPNVNESLYAMADTHTYNPLLFPDCTPEKAEEKIKEWTRVVRSYGMYPIFDLVLNHIGINTINEGPTPLKQRLGEESLVLDNDTSGGKEWSDVQQIRYVTAGSKPTGIKALALDHSNIDSVFKLLWQPLIEKYINEFGFMGARVDAITHVPARVQQRAYNLIHQAVQAKFGVSPIIVGELMTYNPEKLVSSLKECGGFTHLMHPCSYFWGHNKDGGYDNFFDNSSFLKQHQQLSEALLNRGPQINLEAKKSLIPNTLTLNNDYFVLCHGLKNGTKITKGELKDLQLIDANDQLKKSIDTYQPQYKKYKHEMTKSSKNDMTKNTSKKKESVSLHLLSSAHYILTTPELNVAPEKHKNITNFLRDALTTLRDENVGGLIGVVGNHDTGTLKAKVMLDIAYCRALSNGWDKGTADSTYATLKNTGLKAIRNTNQLIHKLQTAFYLTDLEVQHLFLEVNMRMREKLFILATVCAGGWYSIAGDEVGVCHKPEVFKQFGENKTLVGSSLKKRLNSPTHQHDFRGFIQGVNRILDELPAASQEDMQHTRLHYAVLENEEFGKRAADLIFTVVRYHEQSKTYYILAHYPANTEKNAVEKKLADMLRNQSCWNKTALLFVVDELGNAFKSDLNFSESSIILKNPTRLLAKEQPPFVEAAINLSFENDTSNFKKEPCSKSSFEEFNFQDTTQTSLPSSGTDLSPESMNGSNISPLTRRFTLFSSTNTSLAASLNQLEDETPQETPQGTPKGTPKETPILNSMSK